MTGDNHAEFIVTLSGVTIFVASGIAGYRSGLLLGLLLMAIGVVGNEIQGGEPDGE